MKKRSIYLDSSILLLLFLVLSCNYHSRVIKSKELIHEYNITKDNNVEIIKKSICNNFKKITILDKDQIPIKRSWYQLDSKPFFELEILNGQFLIGEFHEDRLDTSKLEMPKIKVINLDSNKTAIELTSDFYPIGLIDYGNNFEAIDVFSNDLIDKRLIFFDKSKLITREYVIMKFGFKTEKGKYIKLIENIKIVI